MAIITEVLFEGDRTIASCVHEKRTRGNRKLSDGTAIRGSECANCLTVISPVDMI